MTEPAPNRPPRPIRVVSNILGKLRLASRTQAALYAVEHGLVPPA